ncbi:riboflavin synthase subunit beta [Polaribacter sp. WD7]|uniref:riboflavin synthase subunit beta n=1 Tax=Polaribacter sp. WD7 TaxID=2269061 RepID=UPI000DF4B3E8|nr:riboflavin synthase subunit beta [Polaribacter sp. WD7]RCS27127.1 riboflavin synthase subunit beta [Polaribacter sp. WD7]
MGFLKRTHKQFDYQPRYYKGEGNPYKIEHKLDQFRKTVGRKKGIKTKFVDAFDELKDMRANGVNKTILIIIALLVLLFLFIIDFDLSIFTKK